MAQSTSALTDLRPWRWLPAGRKLAAQISGRWLAIKAAAGDGLSDVITRDFADDIEDLYSPRATSP
jgi:hypothetical protein